MRILFVHAFYQQLGGEDQTFRAEAELLRARGTTVETFTFDNQEIEGWSSARKLGNLVWNRDSKREIGQVMDSFLPDVMHVQNTFPGMSPSVYSAAADRGIPVIQKMSNYRLFCVNGLLFRDGTNCESCLGKKFAWRAAVHGCYRGNRVMSAAIAASQGLHWAIGTWGKRIAGYVALDEDGKNLFIQAGLDPEKVFVKPEMLEPFPAAGKGDGGFALFAGRLAPGKGVKTLIKAWKDQPELPPLHLAGDGPLREELEAMAADDAGIRFLGRVPAADLASLMGQALCQVVPSEFKEPFGRVALEAIAKGTPVVASTRGALKNVIRHGVSGTHFSPGDVEGLRTAAHWLLEDADRLAQMRKTARKDALERFSGDANFQALMDIYRAVQA
jgi:glycosyltransferase involved in cell wall biosynthesis